MRKSLTLLLLLIAVAINASANTMKVNLTFITNQANQSPEKAWTTQAMVADLANLIIENGKDSNTRMWVQDGTSSRFGITANYDLSEPQELYVNNQKMLTVAGLKFKTTSNVKDKIRIDPNKNRGLMLLDGVTLIIPNLKKGDRLAFATRSGSNGISRTWTMTNATVNSGDLTTSAGVFNDVLSTVDADGDVTLSPDGLMNLSYITVFSESDNGGGTTGGGDFKLNIWDYEHMKYVKQHYSSDTYMVPYMQIINSANELLNSTPVSVMMKEATAASGDKHDYLSQARYWWPNPNTEDGLPYIRKDGQSNPEIDKLDRNRLGDMASNVTTLSLAYFLTGDEKYAAKAAEQLKVWFLNPDTKMNPNLNYGQIVPGQDNNKGRAESVLDAYSFIEMLDAVPLLSGSESFTDEDNAQLKAWFTEFAQWLMTSSIAIEEYNASNNHGIAYDVQLITIANFIGNTTVRDEYINTFLNRRILKQINEDGKQPEELSRTLAYHYSQYNLTHIIDIFQIARNAGVEVGGDSKVAFERVAKGLDFLAQYLDKDVSAWPYQQISGWDSAKKEVARDLYRAWLLFPERTDYLDLYKQYGPTNEKDRFTLLYIRDNNSTTSINITFSESPISHRQYTISGTIAPRNYNGITIEGGKKYVKTGR